MREILFRAIDHSYSKYSGYPDNVWRYGDLKQYENGAVGIADKPKACGYSSFSNRVIPETVGQFTGMLDKNGVKIFEGDILNCYSSNLDGTDVWGAFEITDITDYNQMSFLEFCNEVKVIGNIHEKGE